MNKPEMIIFDYGHTLLYEPGFNLLNGEKAAFIHITENPHNITPEMACDAGIKLFEKYGEARKIGLEIHEWQGLRYKYEFLGIRFDISYKEIEKIIWDNISLGARMPFVAEMLDYINSHAIRSGVISNIGWSGAALTERINRLLPNNKFEFIIASSDYGIRKPDKMLFELALKKAGLNDDKVWYCGDSIKADVYGASGAGIFPVLYEDDTVENPWAGQNSGLKIDFDYLYINNWNEMIKVLKGLE